MLDNIILHQFLVCLCLHEFYTSLICTFSINSSNIYTSSYYILPSMHCHLPVPWVTRNVATRISRDKMMHINLLPSPRAAKITI